MFRFFFLRRSSSSSSTSDPFTAAFIKACADTSRLDQAESIVTSSSNKSHQNQKSETSSPSSSSSSMYDFKRAQLVASLRNREWEHALNLMREEQYFKIICPSSTSLQQDQQEKNNNNHNNNNNSKFLEKQAVDLPRLTNGLDRLIRRVLKKYHDEHVQFMKRNHDNRSGTTAAPFNHRKQALRVLEKFVKVQQRDSLKQLFKDKIISQTVFDEGIENLSSTSTTMTHHHPQHQHHREKQQHHQQDRDSSMVMTNSSSGKSRLTPSQCQTILTKLLQKAKNDNNNNSQRYYRGNNNNSSCKPVTEEFWFRALELLFTPIHKQQQHQHHRSSTSTTTSTNNEIDVNNNNNNYHMTKKFSASADCHLRFGEIHTGHINACLSILREQRQYQRAVELAKKVLLRGQSSSNTNNNSHHSSDQLFSSIKVTRTTLMSCSLVLKEYADRELAELMLKAQEEEVHENENESDHSQSGENDRNSSTITTSSKSLAFPFAVWSASNTLLRCGEWKKACEWYTRNIITNNNKKLSSSSSNNDNNEFTSHLKLTSCIAKCVLKPVRIGVMTRGGTTTTSSMRSVSAKVQQREKSSQNDDDDNNTNNNNQEKEEEEEEEEEVTSLIAAEAREEEFEQFKQDRLKKALEVIANCKNVEGYERVAQGLRDSVEKRW